VVIKKRGGSGGRASAWKKKKKERRLAFAGVGREGGREGEGEKRWRD